MKTKFFIVILFLCSVAGIIFFLIQRNWLIIQFTYTQPAATQQNPHNVTSKKNIRIFYKNKGGWHHEEASIVWNEHNQEQALGQLIKQWLMTLAGEQLIPRNCILESVVFSSSGNEAFVSFDRSFLLSEQSILKKWYVIEGLFKTIHHAGISLTSLMFLVHDQPMTDDHIEFSQPIPAQQRLE
ncbi:MAG: hypothetical protein WC365_03040 [Candidatus Babeliales bacterium]